VSAAHEFSHCTVFSSFMLFPLSPVHIFSSALFSQVPTISALPSLQVFRFQMHTKEQAKVYFYVY